MKIQHWVWAWGLAALCCAVGASAQASVLERVAGGGKLVIQGGCAPAQKEAVTFIQQDTNFDAFGESPAFKLWAPAEHPVVCWRGHSIAC